MLLKKHILSLIIACAYLTGFAQGNLSGKEKIEALKVAFITKRLELTPKEAQVFWPLYNEYQQKREDIRHAQIKSRARANQTYTNLSDQEIEQLTDQEITFQQKELDIQKDFHKKLKAVLPIRKVALFYKAEEDFKRELIKQLKERP